jgi:3',5'-cyclic AMP phosphodiesterase CpdA
MRQKGRSPANISFRKDDVSLKRRQPHAVLDHEPNRVAGAPLPMFTLAHLSDVHLAPLPRPRLTALNPKQALGLMNWHRTRKSHHLRGVLDAITADIAASRPDHIVVTGDLVNLGLPGEQAAALTWLESLGLPAQVTAIPGNHDVYGSTDDPGVERWRPYMRDDAGGTGFPFVKTFGRIALIGTSSAVPTPVFFATGRLGEAQRHALAATLAQLRQSSHVRVVLIHHPPLPGQADRLRGLEDAPELAALLAREGAELVLHGHNHQPMLAMLSGQHGPIPVVGAPSASAAPGHHEPGAGYNLLSFLPEGDGCRIQLTRRGLSADGRLADRSAAQLTP